MFIMGVLFAAWLLGLLFYWCTYFLFGFSASYFTGTGSLRDFVFYFGSAVMQSYAALIAIPFTIAIVHLQSRYGFVAVDFLSRYSWRLFIVFGAIILAVFSAMTIANSEIYSQNSILRGLFQTMLVAIALLPLPFIINYIKSLFTLKPSDIVDFLLIGKRINEKLRAGKYNRLREVLSKVFLLTGLCISDPSLELELGKVVNRINEFFYNTIIPYMKENTINSEDLKDENNIMKRLIRLILICFNKYIVNYMKYSKVQKPLIDHKDLFPLIDAINDLLRIGIEKEIISIEREYCYFADNLREIISLYIEGRSTGSAFYIFDQVYLKLLESKDDILDLRHIQNAILKCPKKYRESKLFPFTYDFYIDYTATIPCMMFKLLLQKLPQNDIKKISLELELFLVRFLKYPILMLGYSFNEYAFSEYSCECSKNCADTIVELILEQRDVPASLLLALLIAWMVEAYIMAENVLSDDDRSLILKRIRTLSSIIHDSLIKRNIDAYVVLHDSGKLKLMFNGHSAPLSEPLYVHGIKSLFADIISKYSVVKICEIIHDILGFETKGCNQYRISDKE